MKVALSHFLNAEIDKKLKVTGSKSESNRLLLLQSLYPNISLSNISESDDSKVLAKGLSITNGVVDIHHAGTAMRFLTAYFASQEGKEVILTGSKRMQERPIGILVDALRSMGASITYEKKEGYPPLKIVGKKITADSVSISANISSQFISALMLIAPSLTNGLTIILEGKITSIPYINMTLTLLHKLGLCGTFSGNTIQIFPALTNEVQKMNVVVESDWSSASYFYSIVAMSKQAEIVLSSYHQNSLQGDSSLSKLYETLGVKTEFLNETHSIKLTKVSNNFLDAENGATEIDFDLVNTPDIAQTIAVTCFGLGKGCYLRGLHTLKIKETDRLKALKVELEKLGAIVDITEKSLRLFPSAKISEGISINTYQDHRMAMAFAPLALKVPIIVNDAEVVSKSFPTFWQDLEILGFTVNKS